MTLTLVVGGLVLAPPTGWLLGAWLADLTWRGILRRGGSPNKSPACGSGARWVLRCCHNRACRSLRTQQAHHLNAEPHRWFRHRTQFRQLPRSRLFLGTAATNIALHR
jgi:hypothetical protein